MASSPDCDGGDMKHGKHKMNGHMMSDKAMKKKMRNPAMPKKGKRGKK